MAKRTRKTAQARKLQIIETAIELAGDMGPDRLTTQHLADAIGISQPAIFKHFPTKAQIWLAVAEYLGKSGPQNSQCTPKTNLPGAAKLKALANRNLGFIQRTPAIPAILFSQELHADNAELRAIFAKLVAHNHAMFADAITDAISDGAFRADLDADDAAYLVLALIQGLAMRWTLSERRFDLVAEGERLLTLQVRAFC